MNYKTDISQAKEGSEENPKKDGQLQIAEVNNFVKDEHQLISGIQYDPLYDDLTPFSNC